MNIITTIIAVIVFFVILIVPHEFGHFIVAKLMGVKVDSAQVVFGSNFIPKLENEPGLIGRIAGSQKGKTVGPWKGENGVYVFTVYDVKTDGRKPSKEELDQRFKQQRGGGLYANPNAMSYVLSRATKVKRSLINFY